jgi:beta-xylosidase
LKKGNIVADLPVYQDAARSASERADDLLSHMTLEEKIAQLGSHWVYELLDSAAFSVPKAQTLLANGIGHITRIGGASSLRPGESAALANRIQKYLLENTRLKIPAVVHEECCSGYMALGATVFPQAIGIASTWEPELVEAMTGVIRRQMRSVGAHHTLAPVLDVARDARWGRVEETFGEDPYLVARMGVAYVKGIQGRDLKNGIVATGKHFVGYGIAEGGLNWAPSHIAPRELRETYLYPFEAAVREAGLASMMNGYNELDGIPCASNRELLTEILRDEWGFTGTVVSDYFAVTELTRYHQIARDKAEAAHIALDAGMDIELPFTDSFGAPLLEAVKQGQIPLELVNRAVRRALTQKFELGLFEQPYVDAGKVAFDTAEDRALARQLAQKSIVLLKNDNHLLPLSKDVGSIAVIGPNADSVRNLFGDYAYPAHIESLMEMKHHGNIFNMPLTEDIELADDFITAISVLQAVKTKVSAATQVTYAKGCEVNTPSTGGFAEAVDAAKKAAVAIVVVGDKAGLSDDCTSGEARDRAVLTLPGVQMQLVRAIYDTGTPVILVMVNGRPVTLEWIADDIPAIVEAWFPSEEGANAIADALFGDIDPGGKLPMTFPRAVGQIPIFYSHPPSGGRSNWKVDYVETSTRPLYPFGYGLSYTCFELSNLRIEPAMCDANGSVNLRVDVKNTGDHAGDEVVQLYTHQTVRYVTRPLKELKGFKRVTLQPGETKTVTIRLFAAQFAFYNRNMKWGVEPGMVEVMVGTSAEDIHCAGQFEITDGEPVGRKVFFSQASEG